MQKKKIDAATHILRQGVYTPDSGTYCLAFNALVKLPWKALSAIELLVTFHLSEYGDTQLAVEKILGRVVEVK